MPLQPIEDEELNKERRVFDDLEGISVVLDMDGGKFSVKTPFDYLVLIDREGFLRYVNKVPDILKDKEVVDNYTIYDFIQEKDRDRIKKLIDAVFEEGKSGYFENYAELTDNWTGSFVSPVRVRDEIVLASVMNLEITDQIQAREALKLSEEKFSRSFYRSPTAMLMVDFGQMEILNANEAHSRMTGYSREEIINRPGLLGFTLTDAGDDQTVLSVKEMVSRFESVRGKEMKGKRKDGEDFYALIFAEPVRTTEQNLYLITVVEITERKKAEQEIKEKEEKYRTLIELASEAILTVIPPEGRIAEANEAALNLLGYTKQELSQMDGFQIIAPEAVESTMEKWQGQLAERGVFFLETLWLNKKGERVEVELSGKPITVGGKSYFQIIGRNITAKKRVEARLKFQAQLLETVQQAVLVHDFEGRIVYWNPFAEQLFGWKDTEATGKAIQALIYPKNEGKALQKRINSLRKGESWKGELRVKNKAGRDFPVLSTMTPMQEEGREAQLVISLFLDISERKLAELKLEKAFEEIQELKNQLQAENIYLREELERKSDFENMVFASQTFEEVLKNLEKVAPLDATVLISGETGTGKELIARAIHNLSPRSAKPLIKVNCGAIPEKLVESELFGYEPGAFTGASRAKAGRFELAHKGSILLDEIGEMSLEVQVKLLRVLQEGEFERLGATRTTKVDVRVIAATNRNLEKDIEEGSFRRDLFYRLNIFPIHLPPLRKRRIDIPILVEHFVLKFSKKYKKDVRYVPREAMDFLQAYSWPGNVRELENMIERAVILSKSNHLFLPETEGNNSKNPSAQPALSLDEVQRQHIIKVLDMSQWTIEGKTGAAHRLGLKPSTLRDKMKKLGIRRPV